MKKRRNEIVLGIVGVTGILVCVGAILAFLQITDPVDTGDETTATETFEVAVQEIEPVLPETTAKPVELKVEQIKPESAEIIKPEETKEEQPIQEVPVATEMPKDKPELKEGEDLGNPEKTPEYVEQPKPTTKPADTVVSKPAQDDSHPGQIYVEGFGWIQRGGENKSIYAADMYENGNKIGDM